MKTKFSLAFLLSFISCLLSSQVPQGFNYQAIARDAVSGNPITDPVDVKIAILSDDDPVTIIREELFTAVDPDEHGLFSIVVGQGAYSSGPVNNFSDIDWTVTPKYILTKIYYGGDWQNLGPARLWSVPYAMYSPSTNPWLLNGSSLYYSMGYVGIETDIPVAPLTVRLNDNTGITYPLYLQNQSGDWTATEKGVGLKFGRINPTSGHDYGTIRGTIASASGGDGRLQFIGGGGTDPHMTINHLGNVGIGTITPACKLEVNGEILSSSSKIANSGTQTGLTIFKANNSTDQKFTELLSMGSDFVGRFVNDAYSQAENWLNVSRNSGTYTVKSVTIPSGKFAVGTSTPTGRFEIATPDTWSDEIPLFEVKNKHGIPVLAVYNNGVKINIEYDPDGTKGPKGGFAIGGYDYTKDVTPMQTFMNITPDSIRFNINNNTTGKGPKGGFAIGGFGTTKGSINEDFLHITPQSSSSGNYTTKMGFEAGKNTTGPHNTFIGYWAGRGADTGNGSASNIFIGEASGKNNTGGSEAFPLQLPDGSWIWVYNTWGGNNVAVGNYTGVNLAGNIISHTGGQSNVLMGHYAGHKLSSGSKNVIIGNSSGYNLVSGDNNVFLGFNAGSNETGSNKLYIDNSNTSTPLIYGNFDWNYLNINGSLSVTSDYEGDPSSAAIENIRPNYPQLILKATSAAANAKIWRVVGRSTNMFEIQTLDDTYGGEVTAMRITRSGTAISSVVFPEGNVGIGLYSPAVKLDVDGNARFRQVGSLTYYAPLNITSLGTLTTATSDISMKKDIVDINAAIQKVLEMRGVYFSWKEDNSGKRRVGFIAQDMEKVLPEVVFTNPVDGLKGINYAEISAVLAEAIEEQQKQIESQQQQIDRLEALVEKLMEQ